MKLFIKGTECSPSWRPRTREPCSITASSSNGRISVSLAVNGWEKLDASRRKDSESWIVVANSSGPVGFCESSSRSLWRLKLSRSDIFSGILLVARALVKIRQSPQMINNSPILRNSRYFLVFWRNIMASCVLDAFQSPLWYINFLHIWLHCSFWKIGSNTSFDQSERFTNSTKNINYTLFTVCTRISKLSKGYLISHHHLNLEIYGERTIQYVLNGLAC